MSVKIARCSQQASAWPRQGRHILAQYDDETMLVYQAYNPKIGRYALRHQHFGGDFSYGRMSWIKPNFLWMMYRSAWGTNINQECVLALRLRRDFFDLLLSEAVASSIAQSHIESPHAWKDAVRNSEVRLQWDPDRAPDGRPLERRAIQIGLRGKRLRGFGTDEIVEIIDMTKLVNEQRERVGTEELMTPAETRYLPGDPAIFARIGLEA